MSYPDNLKQPATTCLEQPKRAGLASCIAAIVLSAGVTTAPAQNDGPSAVAAQTLDPACQTRVTELEARIEQLRKQDDTAKRQLADTEQNCQAEIGRIGAELQRTRTQMDAAGRQAGDAAERYKAQTAGLTKELNAVRAQKSTLAHQAEDADRTCKAEVARVGEELNAVRAQKSTLARQAADADRACKAEVARLAGTLSQARAQQGMVSQQAADAATARDACLGKVREYEQQAIPALRTESDRLTAQLAAVRTEEEANAAACRSRIDALEQKITGLRRDIAEAQARIEHQETERQSLKEQLSNETSAVQELEARLTDTQIRLGEQRQAVEQARSRTEDLTRQLQTTNAELEQCRAGGERLNAAIVLAQGATQRMEQRAAALSRQLAEQRMSGKAQRADIEALTRERRDLSKRLDYSLNHLPPASGGRASLDSALREASAHAQNYVKWYAAWRNGEGDAAALKQAQRGLFNAQALVAQVRGASGLYTVRELDSLSRIAAAQFGDGNQWARIFSANSHILANPNQLVPGMTLVIP